MIIHVIKWRHLPCGNGGVLRASLERGDVMLFGHREEPRRSPPGMLGERVKTNRNGAQKITLGQGQAGWEQKGTAPTAGP